MSSFVSIWQNIEKLEGLGTVLQGEAFQKVCLAGNTTVFDLRGHMNKTRLSVTQWSSDIMSIKRLEEVLYGIINLFFPIIQKKKTHSVSTKQQPPPAVPGKGRRTSASLVPTLQSLNAPLWMLPSSPSCQPPAAHSGVSHGASHSAANSQCTPVICTSLTCTYSDVYQGMVVLFHCFQRKWSAGLGGQSVASWVLTSFL